MEIRIGRKKIGPRQPTYFIADIAANHDGELSRAKDLIHLAAESGADAAKFQHFRAAMIASKAGFENLGGQLSHQATWSKPVYEVYKDASLPWEWTALLKETCDKAGIDFFSAPYDMEAVHMLEPYVPAYKIGSGDITWTEMLREIASAGKPVLLATGASDMDDVRRAMDVIRGINQQIVLMQCNTNYTGSQENLRYANLRVLQSYASEYPDVVLGLSDHTPGHMTVLGAVAIGASVVEKHFTDDCGREGPDHEFSITPKAWKEMIVRTRELELALGDSVKRVENNERETAIVQRRGVYLTMDLPAGSEITPLFVEMLRPCPAGAVQPCDLDEVMGRRLAMNMRKGECLRWADFE